MKSYTRMKSEPESYWVGLINKYFIDKPYVLVSHFQAKLIVHLCKIFFFQRKIKVYDAVTKYMLHKGVP